MVENKRALAFMAHPDDAEFTCCGTLALLHQRGWEIHIATMTPGDCGSEQLGPEEIMKIRRVEAAASAAVLGGTSYDLDCRDGFIAYDRETTIKAVALIRRVRPGVVFALGPNDYLIDHEVSSAIVRNATFFAGVPNLKTGPAGPFRPVPYLYYADPVEGKDMFGRIVEPTVLVDVGPVIETKTQMLSCHASQRDWLLKQHGMDEYARQEMEEIHRSLDEETGGFRELLQPGMRMALTVGILLAVFNNYTGWSGIYNYLPTIFRQAGFARSTDANFLYLLAYSFMGAMTLAACFVVDRFGRRPLWLLGSLMMIGANLLTGLVFHSGLTGFVVLLAIFLMAIPHSFALGPLPWLMMSELYPTRNRARAVAITTTILWAAAFLPVMLFPILETMSKQYLGTVAGVFWLYAVICLLSFLFGWTMLPETKGRTLEEIAQSWRHGEAPAPRTVEKVG